MPAAPRRTGRVEAAREANRAALAEGRAWATFREAFSDAVAEKVDRLVEAGGVTVRDVQFLAAAMLFDSLEYGTQPQKEQACLRVLQSTATWLAEQVSGEADRQVKVPEGLQRKLSVIKGGKKDLGDDLTA